MKKLTALLLALVMALGPTACGSNGSTETPKTDNQTSNTSENTDKIDGNADAKDEPSSSSDATQELIDSINAENAEAKGVCGADLTWYYLDGVLVIKGTGAMNDYNGYKNTPWVDIREFVQWVIFDEGVTYVGEDAFEKMPVLAKVIFSDTITEIGSSAFSKCLQLNVVDFGDGLTIIGESAFYECEQLETVEFPNSLLEIRRYAFDTCGLTSIELPPNIIRIEYMHCPDMEMTSITIPASVDYISYFPAETIIFEGDAPEIEVQEVGNNDRNGEYEVVLGYYLSSLPIGFAAYVDKGDVIFTGETEETGVTIYYSGSGFEEYIEKCPQYNWIKK